MKKLITLILIFLAIPFITITDSNIIDDYKYFNENYPNIPKDENWEYVKNRIFNQYSDEVYLFSGPILCELYDATAQDSLIVNDIFRELRTILPNKKIDYYNNFKKEAKNNKVSSTVSKAILESAIIKIYFNKKSPNEHFNGLNGYSILDNGSIIGRSRIFINSPMDKYRSFGDAKIYLLFNKNTSFKEKKKYVKYEFLQMLVNVFYVPNYDKYKNSNVFYNIQNKPENSKFTKLDKFLLQKLYSDDLINEFNTYLYKTYPWNYAFNFMNKEEAPIFAKWITFVLAIFIFILGYSLLYNRKYKYPYLNYLVPTLLISLYVFSLYALYAYLTNPSDFLSFREYITSLLTTILVALFVSLLLFIFDKYFVKNSMNFTLQVMLKMSFIFLVCVAIFYIIYIQHISYYSVGILTRLNSILILAAILGLGRGLLIYLNHFSASLIKERDVELSQLKEAKAQAEVKVLQSQINPHFLYNALNSIASLAHTDADKTEKMALSLSDLFRHTINRKGEKVNSMQDEVNLVSNYLEIEQIRFGDRLKFGINVEPDLLSVEIPMFMLQPLVENAVKHGISKIEGQGEIVFKINTKNNGILISVQDNGPDFPEGLVSGHGLQTVYDLLRFNYGDKAEIGWHNQPKKEITIFINDIF